jgi:hypothetical protein
MKTKLLGLPINISGSFFNDLEKLLSLDPEQINIIANYINTKKGFRLSEEQMHQLFKEIKTVPIQKIASILNVGDFIYRLSSSKKLTVEDVVNDLEILANELKVKNFNQKKIQFKKLFSKNEIFDKERLSISYQKAILPNFSSVKIVWDLRPVFGRDSVEILTYVPVALLEMNVKDSETGEKHTYKVQLSESTIKDIAEDLNHSLKELTAIKNKFGLT